MKKEQNLSKLKYIIGISSFYHDSAVCLFRNNELVFACEEEKFSGIKHDSSFPKLSLNYIFKKFKIKKDEIESVCYYEVPKTKYERVVNNIKNQILNNPIYSIKSYLDVRFYVKKIDKLLHDICDNVFYSEHHLSHQYYTYYTSPFERATILSIDGVGEKTTTAVGEVFNSEINMRSISEYPHSLGLFYSAMTSFLGFKPNEGEYKVMGLAPYGNPDIFWDKMLELIEFKNSKLTCNLDVFEWHKSDRIMFNHKLIELMGIDPRLPDTEIEMVHKDLAASVQKIYEHIFFQILKTINLFTESSNLCLSGGCAYNGSANGKITKNSPFKNIWIPVAPSDAGSSIGACINYMVKNNKLKNKVTKNPFLGPIFFDNSILHEVKKRTLKYHKFTSESKLMDFISAEINEGKVIGWYQGHCEFGARALGNRSILASPTLDGMKDKINKVIKKREGFRPFAPMVIKEKQNIFFEVEFDVPYMNQIIKVKPEYIDKLKSVTHVDGTARIQTVYKNTHIHDLLLKFEKISGYPILLNTSFNVKDKTMVLTPKDALDMFFDTDMDILVMGTIVINKKFL
jgi:carbamoyltransferase